MSEDNRWNKRNKRLRMENDYNRVLSEYINLKHSAVGEEFCKFYDELRGKYPDRYFYKGSKNFRGWVKREIEKYDVSRAADEGENVNNVVEAAVPGLGEIVNNMDEVTDHGENVNNVVEAADEGENVNNVVEAAVPGLGEIVNNMDEVTDHGENVNNVVEAADPGLGEIVDNVVEAAVPGLGEIVNNMDEVTDHGENVNNVVEAADPGLGEIVDSVVGSNVVVPEPLENILANGSPLELEELDEMIAGIIADIEGQCDEGISLSPHHELEIDPLDYGAEVEGLDAIDFDIQEPPLELELNNYL